MVDEIEKIVDKYMGMRESEEENLIEDYRRVGMENLKRDIYGEIRSDEWRRNWRWGWERWRERKDYRRKKRRIREERNNRDCKEWDFRGEGWGCLVIRGGIGGDNEYDIEDRKGKEGDVYR